MKPKITKEELEKVYPLGSEEYHRQRASPEWLAKRISEICTDDLEEREAISASLLARQGFRD